MKTIGLIGGMSWESSAVYYKIINEKVRDTLGVFHSGKSIMLTVDFDEIQKLQHDNNWEELDKLMADAAKRLQAAGADIIVLCTNTMHLCTPAIKQSISVPFLHIAEATAETIVKQKIQTVALLGTRFTMEKDFYKAILTNDYGIKVLIPDEEDRNTVHRVIYNELVQGILKDESREKFKAIIKKLEKQGAQGVILGCTEIPLLISKTDVDIPIFDTTSIHAQKAVERALM